MTGQDEKRAERDRKNADCYLGLEGPIGTLRDMCALLDIAAHDTVYAAECSIAKDMRERCQIKGYHLLIMTDGQSRGLDYAIAHTIDLVNALYRQYHDDGV